jgi:hypothetical protein
VNKIGVDLDVYFVQLLRFIHENVQIEGIKRPDRRDKSFSYVIGGERSGQAPIGRE